MCCCEKIYGKNLHGAHFSLYVRADFSPHGLLVQQHEEPFGVDGLFPALVPGAVPGRGDYPRNKGHASGGGLFGSDLYHSRNCRRTGDLCYEKGTRRLVMATNNIPTMNPDIIMGVSLMLLFIFFSQTLRMDFFTLGFGTLLLAHITFDTPYVLLCVMPKLRQMDKRQYEAALDLGAGSMQAFFRVVLPQITTGIVTGLIMAFTLSIDDVVVSYFTSGPTSQTLGVLIFGMTKKRISPEINALCTLMFVFILLLLIVINLRELRAERERERNINR